MCGGGMLSFAPDCDAEQQRKKRKSAAPRRVGGYITGARGRAILPVVLLSLSLSLSLYIYITQSLHTLLSERPVLAFSHLIMYNNLSLKGIN
jgi:hypothetical protein